MTIGNLKRKRIDKSRGHSRQKQSPFLNVASDNMGMNETIKDTLDRLKYFSESLSRASAIDVPEIQDILEGKITLPANCPSKQAAAGLVLRDVRGKLTEVITAFVDVERALGPETANKHVFIHTCASGNRVQGQLHFSWDRPPSSADKAEALPWGKAFDRD